MLSVLGLAAIISAADSLPAMPVRGEMRSVSAPRGSPDSWTHDVGHVVSLAALTPADSLWFAEAGASHRQARWLTAGTMLVVMVLKEAHDYRAAGSFSGRDLATGAAGLGLGLAITEHIIRSKFSGGNR